MLAQGREPSFRAPPRSKLKSRHSAATAVLAAGGTLSEAGQLLRHRSVGATAIYAKVDNDALTQLIRPWPAATGTGR